jgi:hypothetical protein
MTAITISETQARSIKQSVAKQFQPRTPWHDSANSDQTDPVTNRWKPRVQLILHCYLYVNTIKWSHPFAMLTTLAQVALGSTFPFLSLWSTVTLRGQTTVGDQTGTAGCAVVKWGQNPATAHQNVAVASAVEVVVIAPFDVCHCHHGEDLEKDYCRPVHIDCRSRNLMV